MSLLSVIVRKIFSVDVWMRRCPYQFGQPRETTRSGELNVQIDRKSKNKKYSKPCQVQPILLSFGACGSRTRKGLVAMSWVRRGTTTLLVHWRRPITENKALPPKFCWQIHRSWSDLVCLASEFAGDRLKIICHNCDVELTSSTPAAPNCCCSKGSASYWSNPPFLIFDIPALWTSVLSARAPECQKLKMVG